MTEPDKQKLRIADIGKIVHYMPSNISRGTGPLPAMILRVHEDGTCNLVVFVDDGQLGNLGIGKEVSVPYSAMGELGTWHWPGETL